MFSSNTITMIYSYNNRIQNDKSISFPHYNTLASLSVLMLLPSPFIFMLFQVFLLQLSIYNPYNTNSKDLTNTKHKDENSLNTSWVKVLIDKCTNVKRNMHRTFKSSHDENSHIQLVNSFTHLKIRSANKERKQKHCIYNTRFHTNHTHKFPNQNHHHS